MTKEWVAAKEAERIASIQRVRETIRQKIISQGFHEDEASLIIGDLDGALSSGIAMLIRSDGYEKIKARCKSESELRSLVINWFRVYKDTIEDVQELRFLQYSFDRFLDSEPVEFDGDIIITDPCYILAHDGDNDDDWQKCGCGEDMDELGIHHFISRDTIYGDWSCSVYNSDTKRKIGEFCADAGMVSVLLLEEVLKYNPTFDYHKNRKWTTAWIKNFKGSVQFIINEFEFCYKDDKHFDYEVEVVGHGVNKKTGKPINFTTRQTGL